MCLVFLSVKNHPGYKLIIAANRDEFYNRKTAPAAWWSDHPEILGGRDLEAGGTWLGVSRSGKISLVTNYRDPKNIRAAAPSRGHLVSDYLLNQQSPEAYLRSLQPRAGKYNGFNLIAGTTDELWYYSNYGDGIVKLEPGLAGLSNRLLNTPWPKVERGRKKMNALLKTSFTPADIFQLLYDTEIAPDNALPDTGVGLTFERALSSMFIKSPGYGTRCSSVVLVDYNNRIFFAERVYNVATFEYTEQHFEFNV